MDVQTSFRLPVQLEKEIETLVNKGYYKSKSELYVSGIRREIEEAAKMSSSVRDVKAIRKEIWEEFMQKAGGDRKKAVKLFTEDLMKRQGERL